MKQLYLLILILTASLAQAQLTTISGTVLDNNGDPLPGANVYLKDSYDGTSSDMEGRFSFSTDLNGEQSLVIEFVGYVPWEKVLSVNNELIAVTVEMQEAFNELNAASISAGAFEASDTKKAVVLKPIDIVTTAGASGDIAGALQTLPGTTTVGESGRLFVRGGSHEETQTFIDGLQVLSPYGANAPNTATRGRFNPFLFSGTVFSTGGYSAEYGQALSSALILNTNDMPVQDQFDLGIMSVGLDMAGTKMWDDGAVTAHAGCFDLTPYLTIVPQDFDWVDPFRSVEGAVSVRQKHGDAGMWKLYATGSSANFALNQEHPDFDDGRYVGINNDNLFLNTSYSGILGEKSTIKGGVSWTEDDINTDLGYGRFIEHLSGGHAKAVIGTRVSEKVKINTGAEVFMRSFDQTYTDSDVDFSTGFDDDKIAGFVEADLYASNRFVTRAGVRAEHSSYLDDFVMSPRLSAALSTGEKGQVSLAYGWFFQDPWNELMLNHPNLSYERADHYIINYQKITNDRIFRVEGYYKKYDDLALLNSEGVNYENAGSGYAKGVELFWRDRRTIKNGDYWISYSYLDTERNWREFPTTAIPNFASKHNVSVVYKHWMQEWRTMLGATYSYSSPRRYNDPNTDVFNGAETISYQSLDVNMAYLFREDVIFYFSATNILGRDNIFGYQYASEPNGQGIYESIPIIPSAPRFFVLGCFMTFSQKGDINQLDKLN